MPIAQDTSVTCPRCSTRVQADYRFCPECAFRIHAGVPESAVPEPAASLWPHVLLILGALALIGGFVLAGISLFETSGPESATTVETPEAVDPKTALTIEDLADNLVWHPQEFAEWHAFISWPGGPAPDEDVSLRVIVGGIRVCRYEVTRGQWLAFLDDVRSGPPEAMYRFVWKRFFRPIEALREDLCDARNLMQDDLEHTGGFIGDAVVEAANQAALHAQYATFYVGIAKENIDYWWRAVADHTEAREGRRLETPAALKTFPIADALVPWLLTPPAWVRVDEQGSFSMRFDEAEVNLPVTEVSLPDAIAFAAWASEELGIGFYIPTRSEFMRAYHNGNYPTEESGNRWPWGFELNLYLANSATLWAGREETGRPIDVHAVLGNVHLRSGNTARGLVHMAGNVREWVQPQVYKLLPPANEGDPPSYFVEARFDWRDAAAMGGSYLLGIEDCDFASSLTESPLARKVDIGFRLVAPGTSLVR